MTATVNVSWTAKLSRGSGVIYNGDPRTNTFTSGCVGRPLTPVWVDPTSLLKSVGWVTDKPDHEFDPILDSDGRPYYEPSANGRRLFCQSCKAGSIWMNDPGAHLYVIKEWELG